MNIEYWMKKINKYKLQLTWLLLFNNGELILLLNIVHIYFFKIIYISLNFKSIVGYNYQLLPFELLKW